LEPVEIYKNKLPGVKTWRGCHVTERDRERAHKAMVSAGCREGAAGDLIERCKDLAERMHLGLVVLFGSFAREKEKAESDLDLAVLMLARPEEELLALETRIARSFWQAFHPSRELDLVILNMATSLMKRNVAESGILLYASSPLLWRAFRLRARREFEDDGKFRHRRWMQVKRSIVHGQSS
jgi:predicted nucleotidyltransferase